MFAHPPQEVIEALAGPGPVVVAGHVTPDADCLGSTMALAWALHRTRGVETAVALPDGSVSSRLRFMVDLGRPVLATPAAVASAGRVVVCDTAKFPRINMDEASRSGIEQRGTAVINIDHHASNTAFGRVNWVDAAASSTCEMIHRLFKAQDWPISPEVASLLYAGIHGDTVGFSLPNTSAAALQAAGDLVACGADVGRIGEQLCRSLQQREFNLRRVIYDNTRLSPSRRIAFSTANHYEITRAGCSAVDIDDQVEIPRSLEGAKMAVLFTEGNPGKVRINLRSKSGVGVLELARRIGGGGHDEAAGAIMNGQIEDAVATLLPLAERYLDELEQIA